MKKALKNTKTTKTIKKSGVNSPRTARSIFRKVKLKRLQTRKKPQQASER